MKEILEILLNNIGRLKTGLCGLAYVLYHDNKINLDQYDEFCLYIKKNRPINFRFWDHDLYYWKVGDKKPRIEWLKKHIKRCEK